MNNIQRNDPCHCGSNQKYKNCCLKKDAAQTQLQKVQNDVTRLITPATLPYIFWKKWSAACQRSEYGLLYNMMLDDSQIKMDFASKGDFFANLISLGLPYEPEWTLSKMKLTESVAHLLTHKDTGNFDKTAAVTLLTLKKTELGWRVENVRTGTYSQQNDDLTFDLFDMKSLEHDYIQKLKTGWIQPDLADKIQNNNTAENEEETHI